MSDSCSVEVNTVGPRVRVGHLLLLRDCDKERDRSVGGGVRRRTRLYLFPAFVSVAPVETVRSPVGLRRTRLPVHTDGQPGRVDSAPPVSPRGRPTTPTTRPSGPTG